MLNHVLVESCALYQIVKSPFKPHLDPFQTRFSPIQTLSDSSRDRSKKVMTHQFSCLNQG